MTKFEEAKEKINELFTDPQVHGYSVGDFDPEYTGTFEDLEEIIESLEEAYSTTDKLSVEKLQEQLNTAKKALTEIIFFSQGCYAPEYFASIAQKALAAIGGDDDRE